MIFPFLFLVHLLTSYMYQLPFFCLSGAFFCCQSVSLPGRQHEGGWHPSPSPDGHCCLLLSHQLLNVKGFMTRVDIVRGWEIPWLVVLSSARPSSSSLFSFATQDGGEWPWVILGADDSYFQSEQSACWGFLKALPYLSCPEAQQRVCAWVSLTMISSP